MPIEEIAYASLTTSNDKNLNEDNVISESSSRLFVERENESGFSSVAEESSRASEVKCVNQENSVSDDIVLSSETGKNSFMSETDSVADSSTCENNFNSARNERTTNFQSEEILNLLNSHVECANEEGNSEFLFHNSAQQTDSIIPEISSNSDAHQGEVITACKSVEVLVLPVNTHDKNFVLLRNVKFFTKESEGNLTTVSTENNLNDADACKKILTAKVFVPTGLVNGVLSQTPATVPSNKKHVCELCLKDFRRKSDLVHHRRTHTGERPFACDMCDKKFMDKKTLTRHTRIHTAEKTFICEICEKAFLEKKNLMQHVFIHTGERPFACEICQKRFKARRDLKIHYATHSDERPFSCEVCQKRFHSRTALTKHSRLHSASQEKIYVCGVCQKAFKSSSCLNDHLTVHTGVKPHSCKVCPCSFTRRSSLNRHVLRHTGKKPFTCELCHKEFAMKYQLSQHIRTHSNEKPYVCDVCNSAFRSVSSLNCHFATHTGERPHICPICKKKFTRKSSLTRHILKHHGGVLANSVCSENAECGTLDTF